MNPLRARLQAEHPSLSKLLHITIAILLYAHDAALPADSADGLQHSATIFEQFCNESQLYIGVVYDSASVYVDGSRLDIQIYGATIKATACFKYLGIMMDSTGSARAHLKCRLEAFKRSANVLLVGLSRIPSFSHEFAKYLWKALVVPVLLYGVELLTWTEEDVQQA